MPPRLMSSARVPYGSIEYFLHVCACAADIDLSCHGVGHTHALYVVILGCGIGILGLNVGYAGSGVAAGMYLNDIACRGGNAEGLRRCPCRGELEAQPAAESGCI